LSLLYIAFLLIVHLWCSTPFVDADETGERPVYIINPGDHLLISVVGHEKEVTAVAVVRPDGMITYPVVGDVKAAGLTIRQLSDAIGKQLSVLEFYEDPQVTVQLQEARQESISIFGDVQDPGQKQFPRSVSVVEALAAAGGFKETADLASARIIKRGKEVIPVDLGVLFEDQHVVGERLLDDRFILEDGDVLWVPSALRMEKISVIGHVNQSGQYPTKTSISIIEALALAGGPMEPIADLRNIRIIKSDGRAITADVTYIWSGAGENRDSGEGQPRVCRIEPGDSVIVLEKGKINVLGEVTNQGQIHVDEDISIMEALALAGIQEDSSLGKLKIIRGTGERLAVDAAKIWEREGPEAEIRLVPGDTLVVPTVFKIDWNLVNIGIVLLSWLYAIFGRE
jgi:polysaccharide export outer membrane protein